MRVCVCVCMCACVHVHVSVSVDCVSVCVCACVRAWCGVWCKRKLAEARHDTQGLAVLELL